MKNIKNYNLARLEIESRFAGLTHAHRYLVSAMINRADPNTGIVEGLSYRDLAILLTIDHAPGRKGAGIPQKQTIRSYLRTIAESCGENFRLLTQGQKLKCQFIHLPKIYAHFFGQKQEYTGDVVDVDSSNSIENTEEHVVCDAQLETVKHSESPISDFQKIKKVFGFASVILCWKGNEPLPTHISTLMKPRPKGRSLRASDQCKEGFIYN